MSAARSGAGRWASSRPGLDVATATDILWTLNHPTLYQLMTQERGWTPERYEKWLADVTCSQLLRGRA